MDKYVCFRLNLLQKELDEFQFLLNSLPMFLNNLESCKKSIAHRESIETRNSFNSEMRQLYSDLTKKIGAFSEFESNYQFAFYQERIQELTEEIHILQTKLETPKN